MTRPFLKMNGLGNDFVVVDARETAFVPDRTQVRAWGDRASGIGFDQLISIEGSPDGDAFMRVWNSDGSTVETCGNALRCVAWVLNPEA
ncbi:MAG: diaminopimelate epimerase, partial [Asticcacaulis sp.]|nr:diaminopimelate epimerase [Asticcacaulis sp.]